VTAATVIEEPAGARDFLSDAAKSDQAGVTAA
jgi:hypothetical protein